MQGEDIPIPAAPKRAAWNKGKLIGAKPPLRPKHVWSIRTKLQIEGHTRDLAMFAFTSTHQGHFDLSPDRESTGGTTITWTPKN
jgi:hypothetical protein